MGRFFPHADLTDIIRNMRVPDNASYNATFTYPRGRRHRVREGARQRGPRRRRSRSSEPLVAIDLRERVARTTKREIRFERLVSSAPFDKLVKMTGSRTTTRAFTWNKVLVFNLGFDKKGRARRPLGVLPGPRALRSIASAGTTTSSTPTASASTSRSASRKDARGGRRGDARARVLDDLRAEGVDQRSPPRRRPRGRDGPGLRAHHARFDGGARAPLAHPAGERRLVDRSLRRVDLLLHRGQHRRGARAGGRFRRCSKAKRRPAPRWSLPSTLLEPERHTREAGRAWSQISAR